MNVASMIPTLLLMFLEAQRPKASDPPAWLMRATRIPRMTRNNMMPAFHGSASPPMNPSLTMVSSVPTGLNPVYNSAPASIPMKRDEYTSLVIKAGVIAMIEGARAQKVPMNSISVSPFKKLSHDTDIMT